MKIIGLVFLLLVAMGTPQVQAAYAGDEVRIKRDSLMCRAVSYLAEAEQLLMRGDESGVDRFVSMSRCTKRPSSTKGVVVDYGHMEGRPDFVKVKVRKKEYWVRYSDLKS